MLIVDMGIEVHRLVYGNGDFFKIDELGNEPDYNIFAHFLLSGMLAKINMFGCSKENPIVLATDGRNSWRKEYFESVKDEYFTNYGKKIDNDDYGYKINRTKKDVFNWKKIFEITNDIYDNLSKFSDISVIGIDRAEADDIIGVLAKSEALRGNKVFVFSHDKDFKQLLKYDNVFLYHPIKKSWITEENPERFMQTLYLMGDDGDDVPQTKPKMGIKTALKLIPKLKEALAVDKDFKFRYDTNVKLINFEYIPIEYQELILKSYYGKPQFNFSQFEMSNFLMKYKCNELMDKVNNFRLFDKIAPTNLTRKFYKKEPTVNEKVLNNFLSELF